MLGRAPAARRNWLLATGVAFLALCAVAPADAARAGDGRAVAVADRAGDTLALDLDIRFARFEIRGGRVTTAITLAAAPTTNVIYSTEITCGAGGSAGVFQIGWKRAAGTTTVFLFDFNGGQTPAVGSLVGRRVTVTTMLPARCRRSHPLRVRFSAEGAAGRSSSTDSTRTLSVP